MSNVYILEPPTTAKVLLKTTVGDIDVELWTKETPKTCRNFIQLCMEGYYDNTIFHRVVKGFIAQGGDPSGDGTGGESIYEEPFSDEFHQRLKFTRRGLLAMANAGEHDNGSQFFFTLGATPELQNKHTIFAKVVGNTIYNMLKLEEGLIENERPVYPHKIISTEILNNPFTDIVPRIKEVAPKVSKKKDRRPGVKNYKLLSFGDEAEEDEEETIKVNEKFVGKSKSTHDVLNDPKLSSKIEAASADKKDRESDESNEETDLELQLENIRKKLKRDHKKISTNHYLQRDNDEKRKKVEAIQKEIEDVKKEYHKNKLKKNDEQNEKDEEIKQQEGKNKVLDEYKAEYNKYKGLKATMPKKGAQREQFTLDLLERFKKKLQKAKVEDDEDAAAKVNEDAETWLSHELHFKDSTPILAKDANTKDDDWFEIYDPRNRLNKRRRGETSSKSNLL